MSLVRVRMNRRKLAIRTTLFIFVFSIGITAQIFPGPAAHQNPNLNIALADRPGSAVREISPDMHDGKVGPVSPDHKEYLGDILGSAKHLLQLIYDVLDLSKIETGKMEFSPELVNLEFVVGEVRDTLRTLAANKRINVEIQIDPILSTIIADVRSLKQILYNYLSNAIKFTPVGGSVSVRCALTDTTQFRIEVEDNGIGISSADLGRLFVEFQRSTRPRPRNTQGRGSDWRSRNEWSKLSAVQSE